MGVSEVSENVVVRVPSNLSAMRLHPSVAHSDALSSTLLDVSDACVGIEYIEHRRNARLVLLPTMRCRLVVLVPM